MPATGLQLGRLAPSLAPKRQKESRHSHARLPPGQVNHGEGRDTIILSGPLPSANQRDVVLAEWRHGAGLQALQRADAYDLPGGRRARWLNAR
jgi:hypothetical protein